MHYLLGRIHHAETRKISTGERKYDRSNNIDVVIGYQNGQGACIGTEVAVHEEGNEEAAKQHGQPHPSRTGLQGK